MLEFIIVLVILIFIFFILKIPIIDHFSMKKCQYSKQLTIKDIKNLKKGQDIMKRMFFEFDRICRKHNLKYWCVGGTLVGVIRHKGWVPWDGDIDLAMEYSDYNKLKKIIQNELPLHMSFKHKPLNKPCSKIRSKLARYIYTPWAKNWDKNKGVQIDIFIFKKQKNKLISKYHKGTEVKDIMYNMIFPLKEGTFNDIKVYIPNQIKLYMENAWGSYPPSLPPIDKRFPHEGRIQILKSIK